MGYDYLGFGYDYLATPYSKYPGGLDAAHRMASRAAASFLRQGLTVYSPIAHTHPIAIHGGLDPLDHSFWLPFDLPMMERADRLIVLRATGWETSYGIGEEIKRFRQWGRAIRYADWNDDRGVATLRVAPRPGLA